MTWWRGEPWASSSLGREQGRRRRDVRERRLEEAGARAVVDAAKTGNRGVDFCLGPALKALDRAGTPLGTCTGAKLDIWRAGGCERRGRRRRGRQRLASHEQQSETERESSGFGSIRDGPRSSTGRRPAKTLIRRSTSFVCQIERSAG
jgi:hypothetical protein